MSEKENRFKLYFKKLFNKFSVFLAPFVATFLFTVFYILQYYDFWGNLINGNTASFYYFIGASSLMILFVLAIVSIRIKYKRLSFMDTVLMGIALFLAAYFIFLALTVGFENWYVYAIIGGALLLTVIIIILRILSFDTTDPVNTVYTVTNLKTYVLSVIKKYSSLPIIIFNVTIIILVYYAMKHSIFANFAVLKEISEPVYIACFVLAAIFVLYASMDSARKKICFIDFIIIASALSLPAIWAQLLVFGPETYNIILCSALTVLVVFFMAIRVLNVDLLYDENSKKIYKTGEFSEGFKAYYKELFSKFSFMSAFALSSLIVFLILCAYAFGILDKENEYYSIYLYYTVMGLLFLAGLTSFICTVFTIITCKSYKVLITDYVLAVLFITDIIYLVVAFAYEGSFILKLGLAAGFAYCLTLSNTRIRHVKVYDGTVQQKKDE